MDEMTIRSDFIKNIIAMIIAKTCFKKFGISPSIIFNGPIKFTKDDKYADLELNLHLTAPVEDISTIIKKVV